VQQPGRHQNHRIHPQVLLRAKDPQVRQERMNQSILQSSFCELAPVLNHQE
jgi:hypothetical protein